MMDVEAWTVEVVDLPDDYPGPPLVFLFPATGMIELENEPEDLDQLVNELTTKVTEQIKDARWCPDSGTWLVGEHRYPLPIEVAANVTEQATEQGATWPW
jgi:hypothetical protein